MAFSVGIIVGEENCRLLIVDTYRYVCQLQTKKVPMEAEVLELQKLLKQMERFQVCQTDLSLILSSRAY